MTKKTDQVPEMHSLPEQELKSSLNFTKSKTDRLAVFIIDILGSIPFLAGCVFAFVFWILWNVGLLPPIKPLDPFPFPILQMSVSLFAIILSVLVLIKQNREGRIDKISHQVEFEVNVRAEEEITKILNMLHEVQQHLGLDSKKDKELEEMKIPMDIKQIHITLEEMETKMADEPDTPAEP